MANREILLVEHKALFKQQYPNASLISIGIAPGRVNLIGEHVDHQKYSVCPAAINQTIRVLSAFNNDPGAAALVFVHNNSTIYPTVEFESLENIALFSFSDNKSWVNYLLASIYGVYEYMSTNQSVEQVGNLVVGKTGLDKSQALATKTLIGDKLILFVGGEVPANAGVSSSSALVVAATSCLLDVAKSPSLSRIDLAEICTKCERHVGMAGGGMDQASICMGSGPSTFLNIHFSPLSAESIPLPESATLIVCSTCQESRKALTVGTCYNKRVFELRLAGFLMIRGELGIEISAEELVTLTTMRDVQQKLGVSLAQGAAVAKKHISIYPYLKPEVLEILGQERLEALLSRKCGFPVWECNVSFDPLRRTLHVFSEAARVEDFVSVANNQNLTDESKLKEMGRLMLASDHSLSTLFECSTPELTELTQICMRNGAYGARLTGAGWGGCIVALVPSTKASIIIDAIKEEYFNKPNRMNPIDIPVDLDSVLFPVYPGPGVELFNAITNQLSFTII